VGFAYPAVTSAEHPDMSRITGCLLASCAWLAIAATGGPALAQRADEPDDEAPAQNAAVFEVQVGDRQMEANIEQWIFGGQGAAEVRKKIDSALVQDVNRFDRRYGLTPVQKKKLELAGRHDIKRYFDQVEDAKAEYRRTNGDWNQVGNRISELQRIQNQPHSELFGDDSMLVKTLKKNVTAEQVARYQKKIYRDRVEWMAGLLDKRLHLNADQHRRLVDLVAEQTPALLRYGSFDYDAIILQMSRLAPGKLRSVLDEAQCRELVLRFDQARRMQSILVSEGYVAPAQQPAGTGAGEPKWHHQEARR
jgi:hypothetical protein